MQYRKAPPILRSAERTGVVNPFGPHHFFISPGSVHAFHTRSRGASKIRLGGTTSLYSPWNPYTLPSASRWMNRQVPPGRTSIFSTVVVYLLGPHHRGISFGSVHAFQTSSLGASKMYVVTSSRSGVLTGLLFAGMFLFLLSFRLAGLP